MQALQACSCVVAGTTQVTGEDAVAGMEEDAL